MLAYVFPGQGSQYKGMGGKNFSEFSELMQKCDKILGYSIEELCLKNQGNRLRETLYVQPALYVVSALSYIKKVKEEGKKPDYVAGHSLGEYVALFAAGVMDFETGLRIVKKRAELMSKVTGGAMSAILGLNKEKVESILKKNKLSTIDIANYNSLSQIVISGKKDDMVKVKEVFQDDNKVKYVELNVSGAFHSRYMKEVKEVFEEYISDFTFCEPRIPVISNKYAKPYDKNNIKETLASQIVSPVKWDDTIKYLIFENVDNIVQLGPGTVLTKLVDKIKHEYKPTILNKKEKYQESVEKNQSVQVKFDILKHSDQRSATTYENLLGSRKFREDYNVKYSYIIGSMYNGISSKELVVRAGINGILAFLGTNGMKYEEIEEAIIYIQNNLSKAQPYGVNISYNINDVNLNKRLVELFIKKKVNVIETSNFWSITPELVKYRLMNIRADKYGNTVLTNKIIAKVSNEEIAKAFLSPPPNYILESLVSNGEIGEEQALLARNVPMADDICIVNDLKQNVESKPSYTLFNKIIRYRDNITTNYNYTKEIRIGIGGGIGTPETAAAAFITGAEFILTGSINQCTVEAGTSNTTKELLQKLEVKDIVYAPDLDMFEYGWKIQVVKRGLLFSERANLLYSLYDKFTSIENIDNKSKDKVEKKYFGYSFEEAYEKVKKYYSYEEILMAEKKPKYKMALIFKEYLKNSIEMAAGGSDLDKIGYGIICGSALANFNEYVKGTNLESWENRHVDIIAKKIMEDTQQFIKMYYMKVFG